MYNTNLPRDYAELVLFADETAGSYCDGDVEVHAPDRWPAWTDCFYYGTTEDLNLHWEDEFEDREEWEAWLDSIAETPSELEMRDITDAGWGPPAVVAGRRLDASTDSLSVAPHRGPSGPSPASFRGPR